MSRANSYAMQWLVVLPLEIIAASITLTYWNSSIDKSIFVTIFLVFIVIINFFGVKGYGEAEFVFAIIKVIAVIGFMLVPPLPPTHLSSPLQVQSTLPVEHMLTWLSLLPPYP